MESPQAVVTGNVIAMRGGPDPSAEQISQAISGETVRVLDLRGDYAEIKTPDGYAGWSLRRHLAILEAGARYPDPHRAALVAPLFLPVHREPSAQSERVTLLTLGSAVELGEGDAGAPFFPIRLPSGEIGYVGPESLIVPEYPTPERIGPNLVVVARGLVGVPYLWGGRTPFGFDCSGFAQRLFWLCGQIIPRDAYQQAESTLFAPVERGDLLPGDLVFFRSGENPRQRPVTHVGLAMGDGRFIHASRAIGVAASLLTDAPYDRELVFARRFVGSVER